MALVLSDNFDGDMTWLGASDATSDSVWRWESGSELTFTSWAPNEPSDCNTCNCLAVNKQWNTWLWDDKNCTNKYKNICEKDL